MANSLLVGANGCLDQGILKVVVAPGLFSSSVRLSIARGLALAQATIEPCHSTFSPSMSILQRCPSGPISIVGMGAGWPKELLSTTSAEIRELLMVVTWSLLLQDCVLRTKLGNDMGDMSKCVKCGFA